MEMSSTSQKSSRGETGAGQVQSLTRGLALLARLAETEHGATLTELAQATGLAPSTAHRLLGSLEAQRFACQNAETGRWSIGVAAFSVGQAFVRTRNHVALARPFMRRLVEEGGETANMAVEDRGEAVYLAQIECDQMMRAFARVGARVPMHASGVGKALLAALPGAERDVILKARPLDRLTGRTRVEPGALLADLREARSRGYAIDDEEHAIGLRCVASTILDETGRPLAALSVSGPTARMTDDRMPSLGRLVSDACAALTREIGGRPPA